MRCPLFDVISGNRAGGPAKHRPGQEGKCSMQGDLNERWVVGVPFGIVVSCIRMLEQTDRQAV